MPQDGYTWEVKSHQMSELQLMRLIGPRSMVAICTLPHSMTKVTLILFFWKRKCSVSQDLEKDSTRPGLLRLASLHFFSTCGKEALIFTRELLISFAQFRSFTELPINLLLSMHKLWMCIFSWNHIKTMFSNLHRVQSTLTQKNAAWNKKWEKLCN